MRTEDTYKNVIFSKALANLNQDKYIGILNAMEATKSYTDYINSFTEDKILYLIKKSAKLIYSNIMLDDKLADKFHVAFIADNHRMIASLTKYYISTDIAAIKSECNLAMLKLSKKK